jgi:hypothetical protein
MSTLANFSRLVARERSARAMALCHEARVFIWCEDDADGEAKLQAAEAAGRIGPRTETWLIRWRCVADTVATADVMIGG